MKHLSFATSSAARQESLKAEKTLFSPVYFSARELNLKRLDSFFTPELAEICNCSFSCLGSNSKRTKITVLIFERHSVVFKPDDAYMLLN